VYTGDVKCLKNTFGIKLDQQSILPKHVGFLKVVLST
jgi:hypothetical protein